MSAEAPARERRLARRTGLTIDRASWNLRLETSLLLQATLVTLSSLLPIVALARFVDGPLMNDEGIFATIAVRMLEGGLPYRDLFEITPPGTYSLYALGFLVFGRETWVPHVLLVGAACSTTALVFITARLLFSARTAVCAAFAFAAANAIVVLGVIAVDEYFVLLPLTACYGAFTAANQGRGNAWFVVAGICGGLAAITNQTTLVHVATLLFITWKYRRTMPGPSTLMRLALPIAGMGLVFGAVALPYIVSGSFGDLWYGAVEFPLFYASGSSALDRLVSAAFATYWFAIVASPLVLLALIGAVTLKRSSPSPSRSIAFAWLMASVLAMAATGRFFHYYYVGLLPALSLLAGIGLSMPPSMNIGGAKKTVFLIAATGLTILSIAISGRVYSQPTPEARLITRIAPNHQVRSVQSPEVARYIADRTKPDDLIYNLGHQSELYFYANRAPASRFFHEFSIIDNAANRRELLQDLEANRPVYIIDTLKPLWLEKSQDKYLRDVGAFINENYVFETRVNIDPAFVETYEEIMRGRGEELTYYADIYRLKGTESNTR